MVFLFSHAGLDMQDVHITTFSLCLIVTYCSGVLGNVAGAFALSLLYGQVAVPQCYLQARRVGIPEAVRLILNR